MDFQKPTPWSLGKLNIITKVKHMKLKLSVAALAVLGACSVANASVTQITPTTSPITLVNGDKVTYSPSATSIFQIVNTSSSGAGREFNANSPEAFASLLESKLSTGTLTNLGLANVSGKTFSISGSNFFPLSDHSSRRSIWWKRTGV